MRAIDVILTVSEEGPMLLPALSAKLGLNEKTCYRIAAALVGRGLLATAGGTGYRLGHRLGDLNGDYVRQSGKQTR